MRVIDELHKSIMDMNRAAVLIANADMSRYTSFRTGGRAALLLEAGNAQEIVGAIKLANRLGAGYFVIGNGTNLLVSDKGLDALVIRVGEGTSATWRDTNSFDVEAGASLSAFAKNTVESGYAGLEWAAGIPGTVGGAVAMNAGAYGGEIADVLKEVCVAENGEIKRIIVQPQDMGYRKSAFRAPDRIVLSARFELREDHLGAPLRMKACNQARRERQPLSYPSAGSTFKRPEGYFAGKLIEEAGLKGVSVGGAQVSDLHAGFIINKANATSSDVYRLIRLVQEQVFSNIGVFLETEILLLGQFD